MRATDWMYYHAQDEANPTEYHPDWPTRMKEMGPILVSGGGGVSPIRTRRGFHPCPLHTWGELYGRR